MIVTCPSCETKFNLPDAQVQPGAQLRCSVCKYVFGIPDAAGRMPGQVDDAGAPRIDDRGDSDMFDDADSGTAPDGAGEADGLNLEGVAAAAPRRRGSRKGLIIGLVVLLLVGAGAGSWFMFGERIKAFLPFAQSTPVPSKDFVSKITLRGVRQYSINNEKLNTISVIEGKAVNGFTEARELIKVEAALYDKDGKVLDSKQQMAGTSVSLFQLQVLGEKELEQALGNRIEILSNNTNVQPGGEVPFMIVFYKPVEGAAEFGVKVIDAKVPPKK